MTKWDDSCDKRLNKLMADVQNTASCLMYAWSDVGRGDAPWQLRVYSDADYAGCAATQRSTTGAIVFLTGAGFSAPIFWSKRQGRVSRSTPESGSVAMDAATRLLTIPLLSICEDVLGVKSVDICGDGQAMPSIL